MHRLRRVAGQDRWHIRPGRRARGGCSSNGWFDPHRRGSDRCLEPRRRPRRRLAVDHAAAYPRHQRRRFQLPPVATGRLGLQCGGQAGGTLVRVGGRQRLARARARNLLAQLLDLVGGSGQLVADARSEWRGGRGGRNVQAPLPALRHVPDILVDSLADRGQEIFHTRFCSHVAHPETAHKL